MTDLTPNDINVLKEALREAKDARYRNRIKEPMTEPNFREMCAELVDALENARRIIHHEDGTLHIDTAEPVLRRAYALLATQPPEPLRPIPVSERLPEQGEWVWHCYTGVRFWEHGRYYSRQKLQPATPWFFISDGPESQPATHWLPANAIPFPEVTQ